MEKFAAILEYPWQSKDSETILGNWAEDGASFEIKCPAQLRDIIIELQNKLSTKYSEIKSTKRKLDEARYYIDKVLGD